MTRYWDALAIAWQDTVRSVPLCYSQQATLCQIYLLTWTCLLVALEAAAVDCGSISIDNFEIYIIGSKRKTFQRIMLPPRFTLLHIKGCSLFNVGFIFYEHTIAFLAVELPACLCNLVCITNQTFLPYPQINTYHN